MFAGDAWRLLETHYGRVLAEPGDLIARGAMLLGAHEAGIAIEQSMLGATHACANPLTARYQTPHGIAIAVMLPHVVAWNSDHVGRRYRDLLDLSSGGDGQSPVSPSSNVQAGPDLAARLDRLAREGGLPATLREIGVPREDLETLSAQAASQWTGTFNPRPFDEAGARELYERAF